MMSRALWDELSALGIELRAEGDRLKWRAPNGVMTIELRKDIEANKPALLALAAQAEANEYLNHTIDRAVSGDCLEVLKKLPDNAVDQVVTDPPYGIEFMGKQWDKALPDGRIWNECLRVLKPGGFAFVMSSARQDVLSRMIVSLEQAGFKTGFTSLYWTYASGFPKACNIGKAVDKRQGAEREVIYRKPMPDMRADNYGQAKRNYQQITIDYTVAKSPEAKKLEGSYGGFQPKPAVEVIIVAMKPLEKSTFTDQALCNGKGVTWLDDCRIPYGNKMPNVGNRHRHDRGDGYGFKPQWHQKVGVKLTPEKEWKQDIERQAHEKGRFPANLLVSDGVLDDGKNYKSGAWVRYHQGPKLFVGPAGDKSKEWQKVQERPFGFSRFFSLDAWADLHLEDLPETVQRTLPYLIVPKASRQEKDAGIEARNIHPTVKPIQLMAYLITMGSRENDIVLDPFAGTGTTLIAARMLKRRFIGIELVAEHHEIAERRIAHHTKISAGGQG